MSTGPDQELKIVFTGPMGAGKTTAIAAISEVAPVLTEVDNTDLLSHEKKSTTVGFDFGRITLADGHVIRLFGTPGQERFRFMWEIIGRGAAGVIVLLDANQADALVQLDLFVDTFLPLVPCGALVIGVGRTEQPGAMASEAFADHLDARGIRAPVLSVDARNTGACHHAGPGSRVHPRRTLQNGNERMSESHMERVPRELLKKQLMTLGEIAGVQRIVLFSTDGFEVASHGIDASASARLAAIGSSLTALGSAIAHEAGLRDFHRTMIESEDGAVVIMRVGSANAMSLAVVASNNAILGQLLWATKECCQALHRLLHP